MIRTGHDELDDPVHYHPDRRVADCNLFSGSGLVASKTGGLPRTVIPLGAVMKGDFVAIDSENPDPTKVGSGFLTIM